MTNDVIRFEQMFADRFTENDEAFMALKSKKLPNPVVMYPWKSQRKQWNKRWLVYAINVNCNLKCVVTTLN